MKAKLQNKRIETLNIEPLKIASDHYTEEEMTKFKKPKKKVKKTRQKLKADDLLGMTNEIDSSKPKDHGRRRRHDSDDEEMPLAEDVKAKVEIQDDELEHMLKKAKRLKRKDELIKKDILANTIKTEEVKNEPEEIPENENNIYRERENGLITMNQTAEFCRTLGDIPTYGMAGNREDEQDMMDMEVESGDEVNEEIDRGKWNSVDPNEEPKLVDGIPVSQHLEDVAILDEEPDVATGVAAALSLAKSKGYIEIEDSNRPSNTRLSHLQALHYSIDDKTHGEDDKYAKRGNNSDRYLGSLSEFREKPGYKPNVKLEYIDDNNQKLTPKEAFRYLSHKFHGKGPGKNKVEKRLKKVEQEGVRIRIK